MTARHQFKIKNSYIPLSEAKFRIGFMGFTLIELMVVIAIIAILAAVGLVVYSTAQKAGRISKRVQDLDAIQTAVELFKSTNGFYPSIPAAAGGTWGCVQDLAGVNSLTPNYMPSIPKDPIQSGTTNCYQYTSNDGTAGGADPAGTEYKIRTNAIGNSEMAWTDFNQQPGMIDPAHDGNIGAGATACNVDALTANVATQGWAIYTTSSVTCLY